MSDVIESYIRRHADLTMQEAMENFLREDRIQDWIGGDLNRRERLEREFLRVWQNVQAAPAAAQKPAPPPTPQAAAKPMPPRAPPAKAQTVVVNPVAPPPKPAPLPPAHPPAAVPVAGPRQLQVLCTSCRKFAVFARGTRVSCAACGDEFDNMLGLIPAKAVGPFAFLFGEGWQGASVGVGILLLLALVYAVLRWF